MSAPASKRPIGAVIVGLGLVAAAFGCGGGAPPKGDEGRPAAGPPRPLNNCVHPPGAGWKPLNVTGADSAVAATVGRGRVGVVFADDSDDDPCSWTREARRLAKSGYAAAVFYAGGGIESAEAVTVARALLAAGADRIILIGASVGARAVLEAAAERPPGIAGVVALSGERRLGGGGDILPAVRHIRIPVLSISSRGDGLTTGGRDTVLFHSVIRGRPNRMLVLRGRRHGVELLPHRRVRTAIDRFLADVG